MQGRLLPKHKGRYQAFPVENWQDEFFIAKKLNIDLIEFILDFEDVYQNPLLKEEGIHKINYLIKETGVNVNTVCADYFMKAPLHSKNDKIVYESQKILIKLISNSSFLGITDIIIPCVDQSALIDQDSINDFVKNLSPVLRIAEKFEINLALETDLEPQKFLKLINRFNSNQIKVNYDTGNSASLGYDFNEEFNVYGKFITDIHIKDRLLNGGSVILGKGNTDFKKIFLKLKEVDYNGPLIMQAFRDDEGLQIFNEQLNWIKEYLYG